MPDAIRFFEAGAACGLAESGAHAVHLHAWEAGRPLAIGPSDLTSFGFVYSGATRLSCDAGVFALRAGMYFVTAGALELSGGSGLVIEHRDAQFRGLFQIGGPVEGRGRLRYIDGCTDTLLIGPPVAGDPCLNLLHIPEHTHQTMHTHPSLRCGLIAGGRGTCVMPDARRELEPGLVFFIPAGAEHCFHTEDEALIVIAYHPDTDSGPRHEDHPMVNRTIVAGVSAARIDAIRTAPA